MTVIYIILCIIVAVVIFYVVLFLGLGVALIFSAYWPIIIGVSGAITLWKFGHDNIAVILGILSIVGNFLWFAYFQSKEEKESFNPMAGKRKRYNANGEIIGYEDKDDD